MLKIKSIGNEIKSLSYPSKEKVKESTLVVMGTAIILSLFIAAETNAVTSFFSLIFN